MGCVCGHLLYGDSMVGSAKDFLCMIDSIKCLKSTGAGEKTQEGGENSLPAGWALVFYL
jgi:hypothetical protein